MHSGSATLIEILPLQNEFCYWLACREVTYIGSFGHQADLHALPSLPRFRATNLNSSKRTSAHIR